MITSKNNDIVKDLVSLKEKKFRDEKGEYLVEGFKMVKEAFACNKRIVMLVGTENALEELGKTVDTGNVKTIAVSDGVLSHISDCKTPQGVACVLEEERFNAEKPEGASILLDGVSDPGNMGTIIRTAAAVGVKDIYLINSCDPFSPKVVRSSMSGIYFVRMHFIGYDDLERVFGGIELIAADMHGENVFEYKPTRDFCVAVGNEANGLGIKTRNAATKIVSIPMTANAESLNVGVALSVVLYELVAGASGKILG